ncbi:peptidogalycan biosysnthesis protein [Streptomyces aureocirculatus]|uniref:peptidogalycan biosysnthesis protein n=1 Tax=Streptomyces aureocirculatus TaxID=67275 RepID=UPI0004C4BB9C|nr:peptidogalycan biosysnthesis protein [Streptomyces aureocirculatus]
MEIVEQDHLVIAVVDRAEAESHAWKAAEASGQDSAEGAAGRIDIVRLAEADVDPAGGIDASLADLGFVARPKWLNWCAPVGDSRADFEAALSGTERRNIRLGTRFVHDEGLRVDVRVGLTEELVDEFLVLYEQQIAGMPRGQNFARRGRDRLLAGADQHVSVCVTTREGAMLVGSLWWIRPEESVLQMRYSASAADARSSRVMRVAYAQALQFAREQGLTYASLGNDPSLFGHVVQPGLFNFKTRFGFAPVPAQVLTPKLGGGFVDKFLSLRSLSDPALVVTWGRHAGTAPRWPEVGAAGPGHDLLILSGGSGGSGASGVSGASMASGVADEELAGRFRTEGFRRTRVAAVP